MDLEVSELVGVLGGGNDSQEFLQVLLLQVLLGEVLDVALGEGNIDGAVDDILVTCDLDPSRTDREPMYKNGKDRGCCTKHVCCTRHVQQQN